MTPITTTPRPRNALVAFVLNVFLPGLGHLYIGRAARWAISVGMALGLYFILGISGVLLNVWAYFLALAAMGGAYIFLLIDAPRLARRQTFEPKWYNRKIMYLVFVLGIFAYSSALPYIRPTVLGIDTFRIPTNSMSPTLVAGDHIIVDTKAYRQASPIVGDVVVARAQNGSLYVRRVAAGAIRGDVRLETEIQPPTEPRYFQDVPIQNVTAKVRYIIYSSDIKRIGLRIK